MLGLMQDWPLLIHRIIDHAAIQHGDREVVSRSIEGPIARTTYGAVRRRSLQLAKRLAADGIRTGDRIATMAWNTWRHVEAWYGIGGIGAIAHTVNPRLFPEQIVWIINHAEDRLMMVDLTFVPLMEKLADKLPSIEKYIVLTDAAHMPQTSLRNAVAYEEWLAQADDDYAWHSFDENTAVGLCYTSGTTGNPKGVLYSHRSNVLHAMQACFAGTLGFTGADTVLVIVPMFHANAWSTIYSLPMAGTKMVLPGAKLDGNSVFELMEAEAVNKSAGVPTVWMMLIDKMHEMGRKPRALEAVVIGGAACPRPMLETFETEFGIEAIHAWGMTETSPLGTVNRGRSGREGLEGAPLFDLKIKQGYAPFGVELMIADDENRPLPWDGKTYGRLKVRGPCIAKAYYKLDQSAVDENGYFDTNDIATIDPDGLMRITDRSKDVIKSGGEWISSIEIENLAVGHPDVAEAAVIGMAHDKWSERPLLVVVPAKGRRPERDSVLQFLDGKIAKWWMPDDVQVVDEIPHTAAGKINKLGLRETFKEYRWPEKAEAS